MGDLRYQRAYLHVTGAPDRAAAIRDLPDEGVLEALAAASREHDPLLANVLATEALNRLVRGRRAHEELVRSERRYRTLYEAAPVMFSSVDADLRIVETNQAARVALGYDVEELQGHNVLMVFAEGERPRAARAYERVLRDGGRTEHQIVKRKRSGELLAVHETMARVHDAEGSPLVLSICIDLGKRWEEEARAAANAATDRTRAAEALRASEERYRLLVDSVKDYAIFMLDPGGRVRTWNEGARRIKGYDAEEIIGEHMSVFYPPEDREAGHPWRLLECARAEGRVEDIGWRLRKDGRRFFADVIITALRGAQGELAGFVKVTRDITDERRAVER